jgi:hypothetical protein
VLPTVLIVTLLVVAVLILATTWWSGRAGRDPASSVATFHRALAAMQDAVPEPPRTLILDEPAADEDYAQR